MEKRSMKMVFVSHANPEDNEFSLWLALQLAKEGYPVWCDLTKLLGGEDFWVDIEEALRTGTSKFLFVLSKHSNAKVGPLQELHVAQSVARKGNIQDFIIPLHIDDLPDGEVNIQIARINSIPLNNGWARGLDILLAKLEKDNVPKSPQFGPDAVASWWRHQFNAESGLTAEGEDCLSNWFPIEATPEKLFFHELKRVGIGKIEIPKKLPYPAVQHNQYLVTFALAKEFSGKIGKDFSIGKSQSFCFKDILQGTAEQKIVDSKQARNLGYSLLRMGWEHMVEKRKLPTYELANNAKCFYFKKDMVEKDTLFFNDPDGKKAHRQIVGYRSKTQSSSNKASKRYWHFALQSKPIFHPLLAYAIKAHVIFSYDGNAIWDNKEAMHRARITQCKDWWNPDWRDRILATMAWLADRTGQIDIPMGESTSIRVSAHPLILRSPVSFMDPLRDQPTPEIDYNDEDDDDFEELEVEVNG